MGCFSDLDIKIREHGYETERLVDSLPPCPRCTGKQAIVGISDDGKSISVRCTLAPCPRFNSSERWLLPSPSDLGHPTEGMPKSITDYSDSHPHISAVQMVRFQDGRNAGLEDAAALVETSAGYPEGELAEKIRELLFVND